MVRRACLAYAPQFLSWHYCHFAVKVAPQVLGLSWHDTFFWFTFPSVCVLSPRRFAISLDVLLCCYDSYRQRLLRRFSVQFAFLRRANAARRDICATRHLCATSSVFRYPCFHLTSYVLGSALLMFLLPLASSSPATTTTNALCSAFLLLKAVCHAAVLVVVTHHRSSPPFCRFVTRCKSSDASHRCQSVAVMLP